MKKWIVPSVMIGAAIIVSLFSYERLPEQIPIHWDLNGNMDNYAPKALALSFVPGIMLLILIIDKWIPLIEPKRGNMKKNRKDVTRIYMTTLLVLLIVHILTIGYGLGYELNMSNAAPVIVGALCVVAGNVLPRLKSNFTAGIRTPWTLAHEQVWRRTQRLSGRLFFFGGIVMMLSFLLPSTIRNVIMIVVIGAIILIPTLISYLLYRKEGRTNM